MNNLINVIIYKVEFKKHVLPHAHILLFLHLKDKYPNGEGRIISTKISDVNPHPQLYQSLQDCKLHYPCGLANVHSPCMKEGKFSKYFQKIFNGKTTIDEEGYLVYRRRNNGRTIK
ncbi:Tenascin-R [Bienertia sinuspersici]